MTNFIYTKFLIKYANTGSSRKIGSCLNVILLLPLVNCIYKTSIYNNGPKRELKLKLQFTGKTGDYKNSLQTSNSNQITLCFKM